MSATTLRSLVAGLAAGGIAWLGAAAYVSASQGFGAGDLRAFAIWCSVLAFFVAVIAHLLPRTWLPSRRFLRLLLALCVGFIAALLFALAAALGLGPWIGAFSFPVLYLWAGGAMAELAFAVWPPPAPAQRPHGVKSFLLGIGACLGLVVALPPALLLGSIHVWDRAESEVHLLPPGFRGPVVIVFRQPDCAAPEREGRARLYRIPRNGVLRTQYEPNDGWNAPDYFYVDPSGQRTEIARGAPCADSLPGDPVQACLMGVFPSGIKSERTTKPMSSRSKPIDASSSGGPTVLFVPLSMVRLMRSPPNDSLEQTGRPTALPRPELRPGRPAAQLRR